MSAVLKTLAVSLLLALHAHAVPAAPSWLTSVALPNLASGGFVEYLTLGSGFSLHRGYPNGANQLFNFSSQWPTAFTITAGGQALDSGGLALGLNPPSGASSQLWSQDYFGHIVSVQSGLVLQAVTTAATTSDGNAVQLATVSTSAPYSPLTAWVPLFSFAAPDPFFVQISSLSAGSATPQCLAATSSTSPTLVPCSSSDPKQTLRLLPINGSNWPQGSFQIAFTSTGKCLGEGTVQVSCSSTAVVTSWFYTSRGLLQATTCLNINGSGGLLLTGGTCSSFSAVNRWFVLPTAAPPPPPAKSPPPSPPALPKVCFKWSPSTGNVPGTYYSAATSAPPCGAGTTAYFGACYANCKAGQSVYETGLAGLNTTVTACYTACGSSWPVDNGGWCTNNPSWAGITWPILGGYTASIVTDCSSS